MSEITAKEERLIQRHCYAGQCVRVPSESLLFSFRIYLLLFVLCIMRLLRQPTLNAAQFPLS